MAAALSPGEQHQFFIKWANKQGIEMNGVAPAKFVGRGIGIIAARDLEKGEKIVFVPVSALISIDSKPIRNRNFPKGFSIHGRLAAHLTLIHSDEESSHKPWQDIWPSEEDFKTILPFNWPDNLQSLLPVAAQDLLAAQQKKLENDWKDLQPFLPPDSKDLFSYTWMIVNTRCFYWDYPDLPPSRLPKKRQSLTADDCYAMCPFLDYFNHADEGCEPLHDALGYAVTCNREYKAGEEVYVSYGSHNNDFLLVEYGFILEQNNCDTTQVDHLILPKLTQAEIETLKEDSFYGNYTVTNRSVCHRTQAALRLQTLPARRYRVFVSGADDGSSDQKRIDIKCRQLLDEYAREIIHTEDAIDGLEVNDGVEIGVDKARPAKETVEEGSVKAEQKDILAKRWTQVRNIVNACSRQLSNGGKTD